MESESSYVFITDDKYVIPTSVAIYSLISNKIEESIYNIYIVSTKLSMEVRDIFTKFNSPQTRITIIESDIGELKGIHQNSSKGYCSATEASLLKFYLPLILDIDKVLYFDGDIIIREDLTHLFLEDITQHYLGAVIDSGSLYFKTEGSVKHPEYFNSGVMLLNLKKLRENNMTELLVRTKKESSDFSLMDQNTFNDVFDGFVKFLDIRYNLLWVNLLRAKTKVSIDQINARYGKSYSSMEEIQRDAIIIHYSSKDKPWKYYNTPLSNEWYKYYLLMEKDYQLGFTMDKRTESSITHHSIEPYVVIKGEAQNPLISVIIPIYNTENYLRECLDSIINQSLSDIEIILVDDESNDSSIDICIEYAAKDKRITVLSQQNQGQGVARNNGFKYSRGKYIYYIDSDDYLDLDAFDLLFSLCEENELDLIGFSAEAYYESEELEKRFPIYKTYYNCEEEYEVSTGPSLYVDMKKNRDYNVSPCLKLFRRGFLENNKITFIDTRCYEDNVYIMKCFILANKCMHITNKLYYRRVREGSTITNPMEYKNFYGYYSLYISILAFLNSINVDEEVMEYAIRDANAFHKKAMDVLSKLPKSEKKKLSSLKGIPRYLYQRDRKIIEAQKKLKKISNSKSYKIGLTLTYVPRKLRGFLRSSKGRKK